MCMFPSTRCSRRPGFASSSTCHSPAFSHIGQFYSGSWVAVTGSEMGLGSRGTFRMARRTCVSLLTSSEPQPLPSQGPRVLARPPLGPPRKELGGVTYCHNLNKLCPSRPRWHRMAHGWGASSRPRAEALDSHRTSITTVPLGVKCDPASNLERKHLLLQGAG